MKEVLTTRSTKKDRKRTRGSTKRDSAFNNNTTTERTGVNRERSSRHIGRGLKRDRLSTKSRANIVIKLNSEGSIRRNR